MSRMEKEHVLADCLEDYHRRKALGESPTPADYRERAGEAFDEFSELLATESLIDEVIDPDFAPDWANLPRAIGEYTLLRVLGRGAMGVVYEAVHRSLGRKVALKLMRTGLDTEPEALERFRREARACAQVRHPHIVEIYDAGEVDGAPYFTMEVLEGRSLRELVKEGRVWSPEELCEGLAGVADALQALHDLGIVHRDVKPSNLVVVGDGRFVLTDFGLARTAAAERLTTTGQALGTPLYMSPEQVMGTPGEVDGRTDVYGLGSTMYELLTGRPIFKAENPAAMLRMILNEQPVPPRTANPDLAKGCGRIIMKATEKRKEDRYPSATELADDLRAFAGGRAVSGRPVSPLRRAARRFRRLAPALAAAVLLLAAGAWGFLSRDGTLVVRCFPEAVVSIDGENLGPTPLEVAVASGTHSLSLRQDGFESRLEEIEIDPGEKLTVRLYLIAPDAGNPEAMARLARAAGLAAPELGHISGSRSLPDDTVVLVFPRGKVRPEDLRSLRIDLTSGFEDEGRLVFRRGEEVLHSMEFEPTRLEMVLDVPGAVTAAIGPGDRVTWSFEPRGGEPTTAEFEVMAPGVDARLAALDEKLAKQPRTVRDLIAAELLLEAGLDIAAFRRARAVVGAEPGNERALYVMLHALHGIDLEGSGAYVDVLTALDRIRRAREGD